MYTLVGGCRLLTKLSLSSAYKELWPIHFVVVTLAGVDQTQMEGYTDIYGIPARVISTFKIRHSFVKLKHSIG